MLSTESRRGRRILARIDRGADLFDGLRALCQKHHIRCAEVRGIGTLELAELASFDQDGRRWKPSRLVSGGLELLQLQGTISEESGALSIRVHATLLHDGDAGAHVIGGQLEGAVAHAVELVVETFDDVMLRRQLDPSVGLSLWNEALAEGAPPAPAAASVPTLVTRAPTAPLPAPAVRPAPPTAPVSQPSAPVSQPSAPPVRSPSPTQPPPNPNPIQTTTARPVVPSSATSAPERPRTAPPDRPVASATPTPSWAEVAAASQSPARADGEASDEEVQINAGDVIMHPRFQRCVVHRVEHSGEFVQVMLRNGRVVRLSLEVLRLTPQGIENGQRIFTATVL